MCQAGHEKIIHEGHVRVSVYTCESVPADCRLVCVGRRVCVLFGGPTSDESWPMTDTAPLRARAAPRVAGASRTSIKKYAHGAGSVSRRRVQCRYSSTVLVYSTQYTAIRTNVKVGAQTPIIPVRRTVRVLDVYVYGVQYPAECTVLYCTRNVSNLQRRKSTRWAHVPHVDACPCVWMSCANNYQFR